MSPRVSRYGEWVWIVVALLFAGALSYGVMHYLGPSAIWRECERAYERAATASDTARVDQLLPYVRGDAVSVACGELRANRDR